MKKLFTFLLLTASLFILKSEAQNTTCNAGFTFHNSDLTVKFWAAITTNSTAYHHYWNFGDGSTSADTTPVHTYLSAGTYTVKHIFYKTGVNGNKECADTIEKRIVLNNPPPFVPCNLQVKFSYERDPSQSNKVKFTNLSSPVNDTSKAKWDFGDGSSSYDFNTSHVFANSGLYRVCLTVQNNTCMLDTCMNVQIQLPPVSCDLVQANFLVEKDSVDKNKCHFTNLTSHFEPVDSIRWTFGDGTSSNEINPTHIYSSPGTYNICIRVEKKNTTGSAPCVKEICKQVVVLPVAECHLEAKFNFQTDSSNHNKIFFTNASTPASSITNVQWNFGDSTFSNLNNPEHTYAHAGIYNVCLKVAAGTTCYKEICKTVEIKAPEVNCNDISKFTFTRSSVNCMEFKFTPVNQNPGYNYAWSFGDGTGSTQMSPSHVYFRSGNYTVYLTVFRSSNCVSTSHQLAETGTCFTCNNIWVKFESYRQLATSNKYIFHPLSNYPILSQSWTVTKLNVTGAATITLSGSNLEYTFNEPGDYRVCLRAVTSGNCIKEYCDVIHINAPNAECTLWAYPNPANNQVNLALQLVQPAMIHVYIYNSVNILVKQKDQQGSTGNNIVTTNIEGLVPGLYNVKVFYGNRVCYSKFQKN